MSCKQTVPLTALVWQGTSNSQKHRFRKYPGRCEGLGGEWQGETGTYCFMGTEFQFRKLKIQEWMMMRIAEQCEGTWCHWTVQLNRIKIVLYYVTFTKIRKHIKKKKTVSYYMLNADCVYISSVEISATTWQSG